MSTGTVSPQLDQFSDSSTVIGVDKTREEYLKLFSRASYSPLWDRPYSSPISGFYDAINTSTRLVLLNYRFKNSHLREQVLPEELAQSSQREFDYESIIVREKPKPKPKPKPIPLGQTKYWHNRRCTSSSIVDNLTDISHTEPTVPTRSRTPHPNPKRSSSVNNRRSQSAFGRKDKYHDEPESFTESFCQYYRDMIDKSGPSDFGLQQDPIKEASNQRIKSSGVRRKLPLTKGQQIYLIGKYNIYDINESKVRRTNSYAQTLSSRYKADNHCKPQFRLNDSRDYFKYSKFLHVPRSLTPIKPPMDDKKPLTNIVSHKSFTLNTNKTPMTIHIRNEPKQISIIPIQT